MGKIPQDQAGAALVEFTLVLPLFLALLFGVVEFALIMHAKGTVTQASQAGARYGATYSSVPKNPDVQTYVLGKLQEYGLTDATKDEIVVTPMTDPAAISVRVNYPYHFLVLPAFVCGLVGNLTLSAEVVSRME